MNSDVTLGEGAARSSRPPTARRPVPGAGRRLVRAVAGRARRHGRARAADDRRALPVRLGRGRRARGATDRVAAIRSSRHELPEVVTFDVTAKAAGAPSGRSARSTTSWPRSSTLVEPVERRWQSDGREIQGWLLPAGTGRQPLALEIHGGPHTLYGWSPMLEWQILAGAGVSVLATNPRGSEGYGEAFNRANLGDWGDGPMARRHRRASTRRSRTASPTRTASASPAARTAAT